VDSPKDEPGSGKKNKEVPQHEINISTTHYHVITEPSLDASISSDTQLPNERQTKVEPSEHMEEVQEPILEKIYTYRSLGNMIT